MKYIGINDNLWKVCAFQEYEIQQFWNLLVSRFFFEIF